MRVWKSDPGDHWAIDHNPHLAAMLESIDDGVGKIAVKLRTKGAENTIFIFTSDNGVNLMSLLMLLFVVVRANSTKEVFVFLDCSLAALCSEKAISTLPTMNTDFYPTLLGQLEEKEPQAKIDGISILANWKDVKSLPSR